MHRPNGRRTYLVVFITAVAAFALGLASADRLGWTAPAGTAPTVSAILPPGSLAEWYRPRPHSADLRPIIDAELDALLAKLDTILSSHEPGTPSFSHGAESALWHFNSLLQQGRLAPEQAARVHAYYDDLAREHPDETAMLHRSRYMLDNLMPGHVAPNIVGRDTNGLRFALEDYRGNIVVLIFSGEWCSPCREEYPYQRFMLEHFEDDHVALLGVNSDEDVETIRAAKKEKGLAYRVWWDGHEEVSTKGPIATAWNVYGWPVIYVLDEEGVIRYASINKAEVVAAVDELVQDQRNREIQAELDKMPNPEEVRALK
ncbi:MAG: TlpA disulfide reductase family protein [Gemmatimonadota bacterium]|nr:TlpA disulfide reductase family protein [Gemmatimonadota bacterium]